ncbi:MAG: hypothetical protein V7640_570 [Betaproteobacteria bacterium]
MFFLLSKLTVLAFAVASGFVGAALYINLVEQPARLALGPRAMLKEWVRSNRRGFIVLSIMAIVSALLACTEFGRTGDVRLLFGATIIATILPYAYFVVVPVNVWLCAVPPEAAPSIARDLMRKWGLAEWGQTAIGLAACGVLCWVLAEPA